MLVIILIKLFCICLNTQEISRMLLKFPSFYSDGNFLKTCEEREKKIIYKVKNEGLQKCLPQKSF
jgi:hypothetical protein